MATPKTDWCVDCEREADARICARCGSTLCGSCGRTVGGELLDESCADAARLDAMRSEAAAESAP